MPIQDKMRPHESYPVSRAIVGCPYSPTAPDTRERPSEPITQVHLWDGTRAWLVTSYVQARKLLQDHRLSAIPTTPGFPHVDVQAQAAAIVSRDLLQMDDPEHRTFRQLLTPEFLARSVDLYRPRLQEIVDELIDDIIAQPAPVDLIENFATIIPLVAMCDLLGVPFAERDYFGNLVERLREQLNDGGQAASAVQELDDYIARLLHDKLRKPSGDMLSRLAQDHLRTGQFGLADLAAQGRILLVAGHEMTARAITLSTLLLLDNPETLEQIRTTVDPELIASAVEELLRYLSILQVGIRRVAVEDIEIDDLIIRPGEGIVIPIDTVNRDSDEFSSPNTFDIKRGARNHLAFGYGVHQCIGQTLVRAQMQIALGTLHRRIPTMRLGIARELVEFDDASRYGVNQLPIIWSDTREREQVYEGHGVT